MYNTDLPRRAELPTSARLKRSTIIAAVSACTILITVVLPSEYAIDPTGVGRLAGLVQMGEIKTQLAKEAAGDKTSEIATVAAKDEILMRRLDRIETLLAGRQPDAAPVAPARVVGMAVAKPQANAGGQDKAAPAGTRSDEVNFTLTPGQGAEIKLVMRQGARVGFAWATSGGPVNFDTHGDAPGQSTSYEKGRGVESGEGVIEAAFDGNHGWFWRNRGRSDVTVTLRTNGNYAGIKRLL